MAAYPIIGKDGRTQTALHEDVCAHWTQLRQEGQADVEREVQTEADVG